MDDPMFDYNHGHLKIGPGDAAFRALVVAAPPALLALGTPDLGDFVARRGEQGIVRDKARWVRLNPLYRTADRLCQLEAL